MKASTAAAPQPPPDSPSDTLAGRVRAALYALPGQFESDLNVSGVRATDLFAWLKGWYALAKEREPSFRYRVTPAVCAPDDLLVVYPWVLDRVISGTPQLFAPFVIDAGYAAAYRNWHWTNVVRTGGDKGGIKLSEVTDHYPSKTQLISDEPRHDRGGNYGAVGRGRSAVDRARMARAWRCRAFMRSASTTRRSALPVVTGTS